VSDSREALPPGWAVAALEDVLAPLEDGRLLHHGWSPQCDSEPPGSLDEWGVLKTTAIQEGRFCPEHSKRLPKSFGPRPLLEVHVGDVLITCAGPRSRCGVPCLVRHTRPRLLLSGKMYRFRVPTALGHPGYLESYLRSQVARAAIDRMKTGISDSGLNLTHERFRRLPVVVAPSSEQRRIVDVLETHFSRLDEAEAALERVARNLKRYRSAVLQAAVEGRLVATEAELARAEGRDYEPASELLKRLLAERRRRWEEAELARLRAARKTPKDDKWRARYPEPERASASDLSGLPEGWCWSTLDCLAEVKGGITKNQAREAEEPLREVPYLRVANVQRGYLNLSEVATIRATASELDELRLLPGDVLFNEGGDRDKLGRGWVWYGQIADCIHQNHVFRARPYLGEVVPEYLSWYGNSGAQAYFLEQGKQTTNLASINMTKLRRLPVPLPPAAEQRRLVMEIQRHLSVEEELSQGSVTSERRAKRLRQSILKWAFEGRLVDQDPNDEPASVLLERIQRERAQAGDTAVKPGKARARKAR